jgi:hypothetical protein
MIRCHYDTLKKQLKLKKIVTISNAEEQVQKPNLFFFLIAIGDIKLPSNFGKIISKQFLRR